MVLGFGASKTEDVSSLIAKKNYSKAIELIKVQLKSGKPDPRLRMQLADVLIMAGKGREAAAVLEPLADEYAREGFAAKAISVLKKIQKADPSRRDVEGKLASLIQAKQQQATVSLPGPSAAMPEIGIEEIGFELPGRGSIAVPATSISVPATPISVPAEPIPPPARAPEPPPVPEIALEPVSAPTSEVPEIALEMEAVSPEPVLVEPSAPPVLLEPAAAPPAAPVAPGPAPQKPSSRDFFLEEPEEAGLEFEDEEPTQTVEPIVEAEPLADAEPLLEAEPDPMSDTAFAEEVASLLDDIFPAEAEAAADADAGSAGGAQIVVSPLFRDFSVDELVAVIQGLKLLTYQTKQIILREGDRGDSLYMLTSGTVKAFRKNAQGKQVLLAELAEGAFFGEGSILTGKPRTATVVAWEPSELLELDRPTLDSISKTHPHVWDVLQEFAAKRTSGR
jgi:hypothetical protein